MKELFNGKDAYVIINYSNKTHLIRHNVTRAFEDDYRNGKLETKQITIFDTQPHHFYVDNYDGTIQINSVVFVSEKNNKTIVRYPYRQEVMYMMRIKFDTTNAAFDEDCGGGLEWQSIEILKEIIEKLENGTKEGNCEWCKSHGYEDFVKSKELGAQIAEIEVDDEGQFTYCYDVIRYWEEL